MQPTFRDLIAANKRNTVLLVLLFCLFVTAVALVLALAVVALANPDALGPSTGARRPWWAAGRRSFAAAFLGRLLRRGRHGPGGERRPPHRAQRRPGIVQRGRGDGHRRGRPDAGRLPDPRPGPQRLRHRPRPAARRRGHHDRPAAQANARRTAGRDRPRGLAYPQLRHPADAAAGRAGRHGRHALRPVLADAAVLAVRLLALPAGRQGRRAAAGSS